MAILKNTQYSGYLARFRGGARLANYLSRSPQVQSFEVVRGKKGWFSFSWSPKRPIRFERGVAIGQRASYPFLFRESQDRFLLLSAHHEVVDAFLREGKLGSVVEYPRVDVTGLVSELTEPAEGRVYRMSAVFAALDGYGRSLRTAAFWGDDIAEASLFHRLRSEISPYRIAIRDVRKEFDFEIASLNTNGEISTFMRGIVHLDHVDQMLKYINERGFIAWGEG